MELLVQQQLELLLTLLVTQQQQLALAEQLVVITLIRLIMVPSLLGPQAPFLGVVIAFVIVGNHPKLAILLDLHLIEFV